MMGAVLDLEIPSGNSQLNRGNGHAHTAICATGLVTRSCPTLCDPWTVARQDPLSMGILQARILEWVAMPRSRGSSQPRDRTQVSHIADGFFAE